MSIVKEVGDRIRELRTNFKGRKLSQDELARELGISTNTVSRWETGTYRPSIEDLEMLARFFDIPISDLFPQESPPPRDARLNALMRGAKNLNDDDLSDVQRYLDFVRMRNVYERPRKKAQGRK